MDDATVTAIVAATKLEEDTVRRVLAALDAVRQGAEVGTVAQDPKTGAVALRVCEDGVNQWKVTGPAGETWIDLQPTLKGWTVLNEKKG